MKNLRIIGSILMLFAVLVTCSGCFGYATRLPNNTYDKVSKVLFGVDGTEYVLAYKDSMDDFVLTIENTLNSGKINISNAFSQVMMPCDDSAVEYNKEACGLWFEMLIENGKYKKLFFTLNANDTQTIWIYATTTDSYNDGGFLEYYACDCKELIELVTQYAKNIEGIDSTTKIEVVKYDIGEEKATITLTDEESIKHIVDNLTSLKLKEMEYIMPTAIEYELTFYNADEEMTNTISITLDGWVDYHGSLHSVVSGQLDRACIAELFTVLDEDKNQDGFNDILYATAYPQDFEYNGRRYRLVQGNGLKTTATQEELGELLGYIIRKEDVSAFTQEYPSVDYIIDNGIYDYYTNNRVAFYSLQAYPDLSIICMRQLSDYVLFQFKSVQNLQFEIRDREKEENLPCDTALEKFYEDESNEYYFSVIKSQYVVVTYNDGSSEYIATALNAGRVAITDLDEFGIEYRIESKQ